MVIHVFWMQNIHVCIGHKCHVYGHCTWQGIWYMTWCMSSLVSSGCRDLDLRSTNPPYTHANHKIIWLCTIRFNTYHIYRFCIIIHVDVCMHALNNNHQVLLARNYSTRHQENPWLESHYGHPHPRRGNEMA